MDSRELHEKCQTRYWLARGLAVSLGEEITRRGGDMSRVAGSGFTTGHGFALEAGRVIYSARAYELGQRSIQRDQRSAEQWVAFACGQFNTALEFAAVSVTTATDSNLRSAFWRAVDAAGRFDVYLRQPFDASRCPAEVKP